MIDVIKKIINSENSNYMTIIGFCVTIFIAFLTAYLTTKNNKKSTTTDYFKKEGITIQKRLLTFWSSLLIYDFDKLVDNYKKDSKLDKNLSQDYVIKKIHQESIIYSSKETNTAIATYQQFSYKKVVSDSKRKKIIY